MEDVKKPGLTLSLAFAVLMWVVDFVDKRWLHFQFAEWFPSFLASLQVLAGVVGLVVAALASAWVSFMGEAAKQQQTNPNTRGAEPVKRKSFWRYAL